MHPIHSSILSTLAYYDLFDCPLTALELWHNLSIETDYPDLLKALEELTTANTIYQQQGFYSLRPDLYIIRQSRYATSRRKANRARLMARMLTQLPWVRFIGLANQIGQHNLRNDGDLDFFIICQPGRIWTSRFFCAGLMAVLNQRPTTNRNQDTICLSFFITADQLNLSPLHLPNQDDLYFTYWLANLRPLYDSADYYQQLINENTWLQANLPNWQALANDHNLRSNKLLSTLFKPWGALEQILKQWQLNKFPQAIKSQANQGCGVVVNDQVLKLHLSDKREELMKKYLYRLKQMNCDV
jgi:hypothetical protein